MNDPIENILTRLEGVIETKPNQWKAKCPSHEDRNPSLAIKRGDDGRVLLKCWAGCGALDVVNSIGLDLKHLFDQPIKINSPSRNSLYPNYKEILKLLHHEATVIWIIASDFQKSKAIDARDYEVLTRYVGNLNKVMRASNV